MARPCTPSHRRARPTGFRGNTTIRFSHRAGRWLPLLVLASLCGFAGPSVRGAGVSTTDTVVAVRGLLERLLPGEAEGFACEVIPAEGDRDVFEIESRADKVVLRGNNGVSLASALQWYLKYYCQCHHSFTGGSQLRLPMPLPEVKPKFRRVSTAQHRYFLNYCCFGYSLPWFDWAQWERLIDWMALNGINLPLSVTGQEAVWQAVGRRLDLEAPDLEEFLAGPPYLPFGWMGCLDGHGGPLPQSWIDAHLELSRRILERQRALGMRPVLQGFTGHVPPAIARKFPAARFQRIKWCEWETLVLDPLDPLFPRIAAAFLEEQTRLLGTDHYYAADTFIEMIPPSGDLAYLGAIGRSIYGGLAKTDPEAVWVLQGWPFFYARQFWTQPRIEAVLAPVPDARLLLLDLYCEKTPVWNLTRAFCGKPWVWCNIQSFGNRVWLGGALERINRDLFAARQDAQAGRLCGLGFVNEGLDFNPVVYDFLLELAWRDAPVDLPVWLRDFARRSYGRANAAAAQAWEILHQTVYQAAFDNGVAYTAVPSLDGPPGTPYSNDQLAQAGRLLLSAADELADSDAFRFDLVNVTRQVLGNSAAEFHFRILDAFERKDQDDLRQAMNALREFLSDLDALLATRSEFLLGGWLADARRWGRTEAERSRLEWNARRVLTLWGNTAALRDYAARQWSGLLTGFYLQRWELFATHLDQALAASRPFDPNAFLEAMFAFEQQWADAPDLYARVPHGDSVQIARRLWAKYGALSKPEAPSLTTGKPVACSSALEPHPAFLANDGRVRSTDAFWATDVGKHPGDAWWQVDFEQPTKVGRVVVVGYYGDDRFYGFKVEVSLDGSEWTLVADRRENRDRSTRSGYSCEFEPRRARYLRVTQTHNSANTGRHLVEVMAFAQ